MIIVLLRLDRRDEKDEILSWWLQN